MTVGIDFYRKAVGFANTYKPEEIEVQHTIQTNGMLINEKWCDFFKEHDFKVGVSLDVPEFLHDKNRRNWSGLEATQNL